MLADPWVSRHSDFVTDGMSLVRKRSCNQPLSSVFAVGFSLFIFWIFSRCRRGPDAVYRDWLLALGCFLWSAPAERSGDGALDVFGPGGLLALGCSRPISSLPPPVFFGRLDVSSPGSQLSTLNSQLFRQRWVAAAGSSLRDDLRYVRGLL